MRWIPILALVAVGTMINYLDRTVLGIAAPFLTRDLGLTAAKMGLVFSAFSWSYALLQIPGGVFLDRFGTRLTYCIAVVCWSGCTALMGAVQSFNGLVLTRIGVGVFEAPCFPANSRILASWFPQQERARANAIYSFGQYVGLGFLSVPLFWVTRRFGWRGLFLLVGGLGIVFGAAWWMLYRNPGDSPHGEPRGDGITSRPAAAANTPANPSGSSGGTSRRYCGAVRCWGLRSGSSAATRRRSSSSPGSRPIS